MENKKDAFEYAVTANLGENRISKLHSPELDMVLECATPPEFPKGIPNVWSPETYLLAAVSGCFVNTYQALSDKFNFVPVGLTCKALGTVALVDGKFGFTKIVLMPQITVESPEQEATASKIAEKAHKYCLISNSVKCPVEMNPIEVNILATTV
jgi:organic hydroperoxide reductase OsmC/OhrA